MAGLEKNPERRGWHEVIIQRIKLLAAKLMLG